MKLPSFTRVLFPICAGLALSGAALAQEARDRSVEIKAVIRQAPPLITLQWNAAIKPPTSQKIYRKLKGASEWTQLANLPIAAKTYADKAVMVGASYEYFVYRVYDGLPGTSSGWLSAGIRAPLVADRGRVILLVDDTMAAPLSAELTQFISDLTGDGWTVVRQDISRTATVTSVRAKVQSSYNADPANTTSLILFGHIPVPYSGDYSADGHPDHYGAWPTDAYYGDVDGTWTDSTVNNSSAAQTRNDNVPGDGKFDQSSLPSDVELAVGRIDLASMPAFGVSETEALRQYLQHDHQYRFRLAGYAAVPRRGLVDDEFGFFSGEAFAATGWRNFGALFGSANVKALDWFSTLPTQKYLCAYGCGAGSYTNASNVGSTGNFASGSQAVFNFLFGSYFGDWDNSDNLLRAPLGGPATSLGLVSAWAGRPHWFIHPLGLGETIGYCARLSQNNSASFPGGYEANNDERGVHIGLMGDPTLRLHPVKPPTALVAKPTTSGISLTWKAGGDSPVEGYLLSRATSPSGPFVTLRGKVAAGVSYVDRTATPGVSYSYMVRAVKRETTTSGTYLNPSQAAFSLPVTALAGTGREIDVTGNGNSIVDGDITILTSNGTDFGTVEVGQPAVTHSFTISNPGPVDLTVGTATLSGANAKEFTVSNKPATVSAGGSATFQVSFLPLVVGTRVARLTIKNNDANEAAFDFSLGGIAIAPQPEFGVTTASISASLHTGATQDPTINVNNGGAGSLTYTAASSLAEYRFRDSDSFGGPDYNWVDISSNEINGWPNKDDSATGGIPLGIAFPFYGTTYNELRICTNGYLAPRDDITFGQNGPLPNSSAPASLIAPFWTDLYMVDEQDTADTNKFSHVYWGNSGGNFVVQYQNVSVVADLNRRVTFEAILQPSGDIIFQYKTLTAAGTTYTVGVQNGLCDSAALAAYNDGSVHTNYAIRISAPDATPWLTIPTATGTVAANSSQQLTVHLDATGLAAGEYYAEVKLRSNAPGSGTVVVPVQLTVTP